MPHGVSWLAIVLLLWVLTGPAARAQVPTVSASGSPVASGGEEFRSGLLDGPIRICPGTVWPQRTETLVMPLMAATAEKFKGKRVLDIGTGSGILALYAAQLGATKVVAMPIRFLPKRPIQPQDGSALYLASRSVCSALQPCAGHVSGSALQPERDVFVMRSRWEPTG